MKQDIRALKPGKQNNGLKMPPASKQQLPEF